jgi:UDP-N-acetyl-D-mannosaminuronic acid dehydrogenase
MPLHMVALLQQALAEAGRTLDGARVLVLGYAYLENSDDTRNSPSAVLVAELAERGAEVVVHDPYVAAYQGDVYAMAEGCDAVVVMVGHTAYEGLELAELKAVLRTPVVVDGRGVWEAEAARESGMWYRMVGMDA